MSAHDGVELERAMNDAFLRYIRDNDVPVEWREILYNAFRQGAVTGASWMMQKALPLQEQFEELRRRVQAAA